MRHERQVELLRRLKDVDPSGTWPLAPSSMRNPAKNYVDPDHFERERRILFRRQPHLIALSCELAAPGASITADLGGVPAAIVRQRDGSLRGFVNACRHRGAPVVAESAEPRPRLSCPYHGWIYELDGALHSRPYAEEAFADVPPAECALAPIAVAEGYGLVFAQAEGGADLTADSALAGAETEMASYGLENFTLIDSRVNEWDFNWKLVLDTFTESYHIRTLHRGSIAPTYLSNLSFYDAFGPHPRMIGLLKTVLKEIEKPSEADWNLLPHTTAQLIFMPSGLITYQRDHIELWRVTPLSADRTRVRTSLYAPTPPASEKARAYWTKNLDMLVDVTGREDFPLTTQIHAAMKGGALDELIYGRNEPALIHLHRSINAALAAGGA
ncbi:MAG: Rieske 2Fe-2S domain-containing protein [Alphaproteobacteria bacterium]|nr:Rieske 2Fe-2S domain-containing protein [Alphaproteobacteria bacterium]